MSASTLRRLAGFGVAATVAAVSAIALAPAGNAAAAAVQLSVKTGGPAAGSVIQVTGKGFKDDAGIAQVGRMAFSAVACPNTAPVAGPLEILTKSIVSETKITLTTPAFSAPTTPTRYNLCIWNVAGTSAV